jgi:hypothetical protein
MKKVLISLDELKSIVSEFCEFDLRNSYDSERLQEWFDAQPEAPVYRSGTFKIAPEQLDKFMQSDNLVLDGTRCKTCGQLGRIKEGALSKMETTGGKDDN